MVPSWVLVAFFGVCMLLPVALFGWLAWMRILAVRRFDQIPTQQGEFAVDAQPDSPVAYLRGTPQADLWIATQEPVRLRAHVRDLPSSGFPVAFRFGVPVLNGYFRHCTAALEVAEALKAATRRQLEPLCRLVEEHGHRLDYLAFHGGSGRSLCRLRRGVGLRHGGGFLHVEDLAKVLPDWAAAFACLRDASHAVEGTDGSPAGETKLRARVPAAYAGAVAFAATASVAVVLGSLGAFGIVGMRSMTVGVVTAALGLVAAVVLVGRLVLWRCRGRLTALGATTAQLLGSTIPLGGALISGAVLLRILRHHDLGGRLVLGSERGPLAVLYGTLLALQVSVILIALTAEVVEAERAGPEFQPRSFGARVTQTSGPAPLAVGARCGVSVVRSRDQESTCRIRMVCDKQTIYGATPKTGFLHCTQVSKQGRTWLVAKDRDTTPIGGDPTLGLDEERGSIAMGDVTSNGALWQISLQIDRTDQPR